MYHTHGSWSKRSARALFNIHELESYLATVFDEHVYQMNAVGRPSGILVTCCLRRDLFWRFIPDATQKQLLFTTDI